MKPYSRGRAYQEALITGLIIGYALGSLAIIFLVSDKANVLYSALALLILGMVLAAYGAHKAISAPHP